MSSATPAYSAAFASWMARTSFCVIFISRVRRAGSMQHVGEGSAVLDDARGARRQASVEHAVLIDDAGQVHLGDDLDDARAADAGDADRGDGLLEPGSSDHRSEPMTLKRGSSVSRSMRTRSIAPGAARWPQLICAPSKAGPVGLEQATSRSLLPSTISALVPTSTSSVISASRSGRSASTMPAASAPTWPAMQGRT